jgi:hypothetical protein
MGLESVVEEGDDLRSLYVTARTSLYRFRTKVVGLPVIRAQ